MTDGLQSSRIPARLPSSGLLRASAIFIGLSVPLLAVGPSGFGVALAIALLLALIAPGRGKRLLFITDMLRRPIGIAVLAAFLLWLPAVITSLDPIRSLTVWGRMIPMVIGALVLFQTLRTHPSVADVALKTMLAAGIFFAIVLLVGRYGWHPLIMAMRGQNFVPLDWSYLPKGYGSVAACLIPVMLWAGFHLGSPWRWLGLSYIPLGIFLIVGLESWAGLFGLAVGLVIGAIFYTLAQSGRTSWLTPYLLSVIVLGGAILSVVFAHLPEAPAPADLSGPAYAGTLEPALPQWLLDGHRQFIWAFALDQAGDTPAIGYGIDISNYLPGANVMLDYFQQQLLPGHPHNWVLELLVDTGVLGLFALCLPLWLLIYAQIKRAAAEPAASSAAITTLAIFWATSLLNFSIWASWWQGVFFILIAATWTTAQKQPSNQKTQA